ncbi:hypothetical protein ACFX2B_011784 [Malus domestica]
MLVRQNLWNEKMLELIDETMQTQAELIKRNMDKSKIIDRLSSKVHRLRNDNRILKSHLASHNADHARSDMLSRSKSMGGIDPWKVHWMDWLLILINRFFNLTK